MRIIKQYIIAYELFYYAFSCFKTYSYVSKVSLNLD